MNEILSLIPNTVLLNMAALLIYILVVRQVSSFSFVLVGVMLLDILHQGIAFYLGSYFNLPDYAYFVYFSWYISFAITDFIFFVVVILLSRRSGARLDVVSKLIIFIYLGLGFLQLFQLAQELIVNSSLATAFYTQGIPIINMVLSLLIIARVISTFAASLLHSYREV